MNSFTLSKVLLPRVRTTSADAEAPSHIPFSLSILLATSAIIQPKDDGCCSAYTTPRAASFGYNPNILTTTFSYKYGGLGVSQNMTVDNCRKKEVS